MKNKEIKCALVVGHSANAQGAISGAFGITEYEYNSVLSVEIKHRIKNTDIEIVFRETYKGLPDKINSINPDFIISLHCNAFDGFATGTEVLYYYKSAAGYSIAMLLKRALTKALRLNDRGVVPVTVEDRGGYVLKYTKAPMVIAEPFFIDNRKDFERAIDNKCHLINAYAETIDKISDSMKV